MSLFCTFVIRGGHIIHQVNIFDVDVVVDVDKLILIKNIKENHFSKISFVGSEVYFFVSSVVKSPSGAKISEK